MHTKFLNDYLISRQAWWTYPLRGEKKTKRERLKDFLFKQSTSITFSIRNSKWWCRILQLNLLCKNVFTYSEKKLWKFYRRNFKSEWKNVCNSLKCVTLRHTRKPTNHHTKIWIFGKIEFRFWILSRLHEKPLTATMKIVLRCKQSFADTIENSMLFYTEFCGEKENENLYLNSKRVVFLAVIPNRAHKSYS